MNDLLTFVEDCFSYFNVLVLLFPLLGFIYFLKDKKEDRLLLFIGLTLLLGIYLFQEKCNLINIKLNLLFKDIIYNLIILIGFIIVLIAFAKIVNKNTFSLNKKVVYNLKKLEFFRVIYFFGLALILTGFIIVLYFILSGNTESPFIVFSGSGIFFTIESIIMIIGTIFCFIGLLGKILKNEEQGI